MSQIDIRRITQEYNTGDRRITAFRDVSFTVGASKFVCVLGQSGCGKTTLLNPPGRVPPADAGGDPDAEMATIYRADATVFTVPLAMPLSGEDMLRGFIYMWQAEAP